MTNIENEQKKMNTLMAELNARIRVVETAEEVAAVLRERLAKDFDEMKAVLSKIHWLLLTTLVTLLTGFAMFAVRLMVAQ